MPVTMDRSMGSVDQGQAAQTARKNSLSERPETVVLSESETGPAVGAGIFDSTQSGKLGSSRQSSGGSYLVEAGLTTGPDRSRTPSPSPPPPAQLPSSDVTATPESVAFPGGVDSPGTDLGRASSSSFKFSEDQASTTQHLSIAQSNWINFKKILPTEINKLDPKKKEKFQSHVLGWGDGAVNNYCALKLFLKDCEEAKLKGQALENALNKVMQTTKPGLLNHGVVEPIGLQPYIDRVNQVNQYVKRYKAQEVKRRNNGKSIEVGSHKKPAEVEAKDIDFDENSFQNNAIWAARAKGFVPTFILSSPAAFVGISSAMSLKAASFFGLAVVAGLGAGVVSILTAGVAAVLCAIVVSMVVAWGCKTRQKLINQRMKSDYQSMQNHNSMLATSLFNAQAHQAVQPAQAGVEA